MRLIIALVAFFAFNQISSQTVTVLDKENKSPLIGVNIYHRDGSKTAITDFEGKADISPFTTGESIIFSYMGYEQRITTKAAVVAADNVVYMSQSESILEEVVLQMPRFRQDTKEIAQQVISIDAAEVSFSNPQTAADLLDNSGPVYVQKSQLGGGSPMIRGFSTNRLLISVDGVRMNTAIFRSGNLQNIINVDPLAVESVEVIIGPGSVAYGSDALGGVMSFSMASPEFSDEPTFSANALARYASANHEKTGHVDVNFGMERWAFLTSISYSDYDDLRMGSHGPDDYLRTEYVVTENGVDRIVQNDDPQVQKPTGFDIVNLMQKVRFQPNSKWDFTLGLIYSTTSDYPRYDRLAQYREDQLRAAEWYYGPQRWFMGNFQINKKGYRTFYDDVRVTFAYQMFEESRNDRDFGDDILFETNEHVDAYTFSSDFTKKLGDNKLFYGVELIGNRVGSEGTQTNIDSGESRPDASRYPDGSTWISLAGYASGQFVLGEELTFLTGLRYNHVWVDAQFDDRFYDFPFSEASISNGNVTGSLGLSWQPNSVFGSKLNVATAFRAPNIDDVGKVFDSEPGNVVVPNPDLKAEYAYNADLGVTINIDDVLLLDLAGFYTKLDNAMVRRDFSLNGETVIDYQGEPSNVQAIQNAATAKIYGFEAGLQVNFTQRLRLTSQLNWVDGTQEEDDGSTAPLRHAAPLFGNSHMVYRTERLKLDAFVEFNGQFDFEDLAPSQVGNAYLYARDGNGNPYSPSWYTLNFASQYQITEAWRASAILENITDQRYRPYSSGISGPGRNLILALKYSF